MVGSLVGPQARLCDCDVAQCCSLYGQGKCESSFKSQELYDIKQHKRTLWALARRSRHQALDPLTKTSKMLLISMQPPVFGDGPAPKPRLFMLAFSLFNPSVQIFWECQPFAQGLCVGGHVFLPLEAPAIQSHVDVAMWMFAQSGAMVITQWQYSYLSLTKLQLEREEDITLEVRLLKGSRRYDEELQILRLFQKKQRKRQTRDPDVKRRRRGRAAGRIRAAGGARVRLNIISFG